jgi:hypothetical protein
MTTTQIQEQISIIKEVAEEAKQSKEYALQFLEDAGILELLISTSSENPNQDKNCHIISHSR